MRQFAEPVSAKVSSKTEVIAGITTFLTMLYIVVINPSILATPGTGMNFNGVMTATVLLVFSMTLFMGMYAKLPYAIAPGMGINAFFTYNLVLAKHIPWTVALGMVFWSGVLLVLASVTPLRQKLIDAIPESLRLASAAGIGFFLTFIGLKSAGLVVADPATFVKLGRLTLDHAVMCIGMLIMLALMRKRSPFALLVGITFTTVALILMGHVVMPAHWLAAPDFQSVMGKADWKGALELSLIPAFVSIFFTVLFDSISTFLGCAYGANAPELIGDDGNPKNMKQAMVVNSAASIVSGFLGTSSGTTVIESAAGIESGGRTGLTSVVTALCFLPCLFIAPIASMVPAVATAPVLILVGTLMFKSVIKIKVNQIEELVPAFLTLMLIPLTFSITQGLLWGFISHVALYTLVGRRKEISAMMWIVAAVSLALLWMEHGA